MIVVGRFAWYGPNISLGANSLRSGCEGTSMEEKKMFFLSLMSKIFVGGADATGAYAKTFFLGYLIFHYFCMPSWMGVCKDGFEVLFVHLRGVLIGVAGRRVSKFP